MEPTYRRRVMYIRAAQVRVGDVIVLSIDEWGPAVTAVGRQDGLILLHLDNGEVAGAEPDLRLNIARAR
jgi:hypothetical protein